MQDYQTFKTRKAAQVMINGLRGWDAKPVRLLLSTLRGGDAYQWVIQCDGNKYLRQDGFVR